LVTTTRNRYLSRSSAQRADPALHHSPRRSRPSPRLESGVARQLPLHDPGQ
jgi:hypothetical protein